MPNRVRVDQHPFTDRQLECLQLFNRRMTAKQSARVLGISHHAVEKHLALARQRAGVTSTREAAELLLGGSEKQEYDQAGLSASAFAFKPAPVTTPDPGLAQTEMRGKAEFVNRLGAHQTIALITLVAVGSPILMALLMSLAVGVRLLLAS